MPPTAKKTPSAAETRRRAAQAADATPGAAVEPVAGTSQISLLQVPYWWLDTEGVMQHVEVPLRVLKRSALQGRGPEFLRAQAAFQVVAEKYADAVSNKPEDVANRLEEVMGTLHTFLGVIAFRGDQQLAAQLVFGQYRPEGWTGYGAGDVEDADGKPLPPDGGLRDVQELTNRILAGLGADPS